MALLQRSGLPRTSSERHGLQGCRRTGNQSHVACGGLMAARRQECSECRGKAARKAWPGKPGPLLHATFWQSSCDGVAPRLSLFTPQICQLACHTGHMQRRPLLHPGLRCCSAAGAMAATMHLHQCMGALNCFPRPPRTHANIIPHWPACPGAGAGPGQLRAAPPRLR